MKYSTEILLILAIALMSVACTGKDPDRLTAVCAEFPLTLGELDLNDKSRTLRLDNDISSHIRGLVVEYAAGIVWDERKPHSDMDVYINTIRLEEEYHTLYVLLLSHFPMRERVTGVVLFYDNRSREFIDGVFDLGLESLYHYEDGRLHPSDLKTEFDFTTPEIELTDHDMDGINDFGFNRLLHNGTYSALEYTVLSGKNPAAGRLHREVKSIMVSVPDGYEAVNGIN